MGKKEFTFFGYRMETVSIAYGIALIVWAVVISLLIDSRSITSWIPGMIGIPILVFGYLSILVPAKKKLFMHIVVCFGLLAFIGGLDFLRSFSSPAGFFSNPYADISKLMLLVSGALFIYLCVKSFIFSRKVKEEV